GSIILRNHSGGPSPASLHIESPAGLGVLSTVTGDLKLHGNSSASFWSGGLTTIAAGGELLLDGSDAAVLIVTSAGILSGSALSAGGTDTGVIRLSGNVLLSAGGLTVSGGGSIMAGSASVVDNVAVRSSGTITVLSGGTASRTSVGVSGRLNIQSDGTAYLPS